MVSEVGAQVFTVAVGVMVEAPQASSILDSVTSGGSFTMMVWTVLISVPQLFVASRMSSYSPAELNDICGLALVSSVPFIKV